MEFEIGRASTEDKTKPCEEAVERTAIYLDYRTVKTLAEVRKKFWGQDWFASGSNHREDKASGMVVRDMEEVAVWIVKFDSLDKLTGFIAKYGSVIISLGSYKEYSYRIMIYDDYVE